MNLKYSVLNKAEESRHKKIKILTYLFTGCKISASLAKAAVRGEKRWKRQEGSNNALSLLDGRKLEDILRQVYLLY
jgi:hypothetical protein